MKSITLILGLALITTLVRSPMVVAEDSCSISSLKATYGFATTGFINFSGPGPSRVGDFFPIAVAGTVKFQSDGQVSRSVKVSLGGTIFPVADSGNYSLNPDCTFTVYHGNGEVWIVTPVKHGAELEFFVNDPGGVGAGTLVQQ
jgi:hypothetical protein